MALKNYTSTVSAAKSIAFIEAKLAQHGARQILKLYDPVARVSGICFIVPINGVDMPFKLPARVDRCEKILSDNLSSRATGRKHIRK